MELIHADENMNELCDIREFTRFDGALSVRSGEDNDWMLELPEGIWERCPVRTGHYIYIVGTEWGGPVERVRHTGSERTVRVYGSCWRGLLDRLIVCPPDGESHLTINSMEGNAALALLLDGWGAPLISVSQEDSGLTASAGIRYRTLLEAAAMMLGDSGRLAVTFDGVNVRLCCLPISDLSAEVELSQDYEAHITSEDCGVKYNHIIALGRGELQERTRVELWRLPDGTITDNAAAEGIPPKSLLSTMLYDYSSVESEQELRSAAEKQLRKADAQSSMEIELTGTDTQLELTDIASVRDTVTGMTAALSVIQKQLILSADGVRLVHKLGSLNRTLRMR